jgi:hypothetical protein
VRAIEMKNVSQLVDDRDAEPAVEALQRQLAGTRREQDRDPVGLAASTSSLRVRSTMPRGRGSSVARRAQARSASFAAWTATLRKDGRK